MKRYKWTIDTFKLFLYRYQSLCKKLIHHTRQVYQSTLVFWHPIQMQPQSLSGTLRSCSSRPSLITSTGINPSPFLPLIKHRERHVNLYSSPLLGCGSRASSERHSEATQMFKFEEKMTWVVKTETKDKEPMLGGDTGHIPMDCKALLSTSFKWLENML